MREPESPAVLQVTALKARSLFARSPQSTLKRRGRASGLEMAQPGTYISPLSGTNPGLVPAALVALGEDILVKDWLGPAQVGDHAQIGRQLTAVVC